jgi:ATP-dependent DNA helicase RecQ
VLQVLESSDGLTLRDIEARTNLRYGQIEKTIKLLSVEYPSPVLLENRRWYRTAVPFAFNQQRIDHLTRQRETEWQEVRQYIATDECKMAFIQRALDEPTTERCGQCSSCQKHHLLDYREDRSLLESANLFLQRADLPLILNRQVAAGAFSTYGFQGIFRIRYALKKGAFYHDGEIPVGERKSREINIVAFFR